MRIYRKKIAKMFSVTIITLILFFGAASIHAETEQEIIASVIAAESCGEGFFGMGLVAETISNRARAWHKTPYQVVTQENQYYGYTATNRSRLYHQCKGDADLLALKVLEGSTGDITGGALFFRRPDEPRRAWHKIFTYRYKGHIFYK